MLPSMAMACASCHGSDGFLCGFAGGSSFGGAGAGGLVPLVLGVPTATAEEGGTLPCVAGAGAASGGGVAGGSAVGAVVGAGGAAGAGSGAGGAGGGSCPCAASAFSKIPTNAPDASARRTLVTIARKLTKTQREAANRAFFTR